MAFKTFFIQNIIEQLKRFADYECPESHDSSFVLLDYASSYLKCHYKEEFYTALIDSQPMGFYSVHLLIQSTNR